MKKTSDSLNIFLKIFLIISLAFSLLFIFTQTVLLYYPHLSLLSLRRSQPFEVRGLYISSWTASTPNQLANVVSLARENRINSLIIDLKDSYGRVAYNSQVPLVKELSTQSVQIQDLKSLLSDLSKQGFYLIARLPMFQDTELAQKKLDWALKDRRNGQLWQDRKGLSWVDPASIDVWNYNLDIAQEAYQLGFDEINFDYIRFPSDGDIFQIIYPIWNKASRAETIKNFFIYQHEKLKKYGPRSVDLFGLTLWHIDDNSDMNIGQRIVDAMPYFDYICPMVYPSHYPSGFEGFINPADHPYEIIYSNLMKAKSKFDDYNANNDQNHRVFIRPWLQAFDLGAKYDQPMIKKQIEAVEQGGGFGWIFWNARNNYSSLRGVENINDLK